MEDHKVDIADKAPASRKLRAEDARGMLDAAGRLIAMKGKKVNEFDVKAGASDEAVAAMLGPTGNLRAPTIRVGKTLLVGFNQEVFDAEIG
ncbi:MAG: hypothetical protein CMQ24_12570 [Gammaproteobacteria bacterium]|nr:hypothetical protein [Gammaproteobacteria bacterium]